MAHSYRVEQFVASTSGGTQDITVTGLDALGTKKGAIFFATKATANGTFAADAITCVGFTDGTNDKVVDEDRLDNLANTSTRRHSRGNRCIELVSGTATILMLASFSAWITDGIRITWSNTPSDAYLVTVVFIVGDANLSVNAGAIQLNGTTAVDITTVGFQPDALMMLTRSNTSESGVTNNVLTSYGIGVRSGTAFDQRSLGLFSDHNAASGDPQSRVDSSHILNVIDSGSVSFAVTASDADASGFSIVSSAAGVSFVFWLAIQDADQLFSVDVVNPPTTAISKTFTDPGFQPSFCLFMCNAASAVDGVRANSEGGAWSFCPIDDELTNYSNAGTDEDAAATSNTASYANTGVVLPDHTQSVSAGNAVVASPTSFDSTGPTLDFTRVSGLTQQWILFAVGAAAPAAGTALLRTLMGVGN